MRVLHKTMFAFEILEICGNLDVDLVITLTCFSLIIPGWVKCR